MSAFERLIQYKKQMVISTSVLYNKQNLNLLTTRLLAYYAYETLPCCIDTRSNKRSIKEKRNIVLDIREFTSSLPFILHKEGMILTPVTLNVGDYVISSVHCIERKSINNLYKSFANGRLYHQVEAMSRFYTVPCLLIEFDMDKLFKLQNEIYEDIKIGHISSNLIILILHFPNLRILWSKTPYETAKLFKALKVTHEEVNVNKALK